MSGAPPDERQALDPSGTGASAASTGGGSSVPARGTIQLLGARLGFVGIGFAVGVVLARALGKEDYGTYGVLLSLVTWLEMASNAGLQAATGRRFQGANEAAGEVEASARWLHVLVSSAVFLAVFAAAPWLARLLRMEDGAGLLRLAAADLPLAGLYFAYQGILGARRSFGVLAMGFLAYALAKLVGVLVLVALGVSVAGALVVNIVATLGGIAWFLARARGPAAAGGPSSTAAARPTLAMARSLLRLALPMGAYVVLLQAPLYFDLWFLKALGASDGEVGAYTAATHPARALSIVPAALSGVVFASLARALVHGDRELAAHHVRTGGRFSLIVLVPAAALVAAHAEGIMVFVYGTKFLGSGRFLALLVALFAVAGLLDAYAHALMAAGRERLIALFVALGVLLAIALDLLWIPRLGGTGAALGSLAGVGFVTLAAIVTARAHFPRAFPFATLLRVATAAGLACLLGWQVESEGLFLVLELGGLAALYLVLLLALGELTRADLRSVLPW